MVKLSPSKKVVPSSVPYICAMLYLFCGLFLIVSGVCLINKNLVGLWFLVASAVLILILFILSKLFSWYKSAELQKAKDYVIYSVTDVVDVLGKNVTKYHIIKIDSYKIKGTELVIKGDIAVFEPLRKEKRINKLIVKDITDEGRQLILEFFGK